MENLKEGQVVSCVLVTGEMAVGFYSTTSPLTGSHLIKNITTENGLKAEYAWASEVSNFHQETIIKGKKLEIPLTTKQFIETVFS